MEKIRRTTWDATKGLLGCGFKYLLFSPLPGEDEPILTNIFEMG